MPDIATLEALLEKIVDASGLSREIDATLDKAIYGWAHERTAFPVDVLEKFPQTITLPTVPHFTSSLDAAIALVKHALPSHDIKLHIGADGYGGALIYETNGHRPGSIVDRPGIPIALALCEALVLWLVRI